MFKFTKLISITLSIIYFVTIPSFATYKEFFTEICNDVIPPEAVFQIPNNSTVPTYIWPQDRKEIVKIRESVGTRCGEFLLNIYEYTFRITAGVPRNDDLTLKNPDKNYPYMYEYVMNPLNFVLIKEVDIIRLNKYNVPYGNSYLSLIKNFVSEADIKNFASNVLRIIKGKPGIYNEQTCEIAALILTSEYFRGRQVLSIAYTEFYKLKHNPTLDNLAKMFKGDECSLIFPKPGGAKAIMQTRAFTLIGSFESMFDTVLRDTSNKISLIYSKLSQNDQNRLKENFFKEKLEKLRYIYGEINEYPI